MSQEGANLPQEVEEIHDQATSPHGSFPTGVESPPTTVMPAGSNSSSFSKMASAVNSAGSSERASPAVLSAGEDSNPTSKITSPAALQAGEDSSAASKVAGPALLQASEDSSAASKISSPVVLLADKEKGEFKLTSPAVLLSGKEKGNNASGAKLASHATLHDCNYSKAGSQAGVDNNAAQSKLANPVVLHVGDGNNGRSKIANPIAPHATIDNTTGSKLDSPVELHVSKDMDNNAGRPKLASPVLLHAGKDNRARSKLAIQAVSYSGGNTGSSRLTRSAAAAALQAAKENTSKLAIQVVPCLHANKDNNAGLSKAATRPAAVDAGASKGKEGKNSVAREQQPANEVDVDGSGSGKGNATVTEDTDPNLHIFTERERRKKMKNMFSTLHALLPQLPNKADKATIVGEAITFIKTLEGTVQKLEKLKMERKRGQQQLVVGAGSSSRAATARHPAPVPSLREANMADMVYGWETHVTKLAGMAAANRAGGSSSSSSGAGAQLPRGAVPFPAPAAGFQTWTGHNVVVSVARNEAYINLHCPREVGTLTKALFVLERNRIEVVTTTVSAQDGFRMYGIHARVNPASASARFPENLCAEDRFKLAVSEMVHLINNQV